MASKRHARTILLIEDSYEDYYTFKRVVEQLEFSETVSHLDHGDEALRYLEDLVNDADAELPTIIFLDLNLPGTDGREILDYIKMNKVLRKIPTIIITTSLNPHDVKYCYNHGASGYIAKPVNYDKFKQSMRSILHYWLNIVTLPI